MTRFILTRLVLSVAVVVGISALSFAVIHVLPGDVAIVMTGVEGTAVDAEALDRIRSQLGLDRPLHEQYLSWLAGIARGDFGRSLVLKVEILPEIIRSLPTTFELALLSVAFGVVVGVPLGVLAATKGGWLDGFIRLVVSTGIGVPSFVIATLLLLFAAPRTPWIPVFYYVPFTTDPLRNLLGMIYPTVAVGTGIAMIVSENSRSAVLDILREQYVTVAHSKGLSRSQVFRRHILKNASIPVITILGLQAAFVFSSTIIIEIIFGLPGLGRLVMLGINLRDFPLLQGVLVVTGVAVMLINLITDILYAFADPRIRYEGNGRA